jgi:hypothetical protein
MMDLGCLKPAAGVGNADTQLSSDNLVSWVAELP